MTNTLTPRRLIILAGPQAWGRQTATDLISNSGLRKAQHLWLDAADRALGVLGQERALVITDAYLGLNPDVFGRVSGLVQAGGALLVICPTLQSWANFQDPEYAKLVPHPGQAGKVRGYYLKRWVRLLSSLDGIECYTPETGTCIPKIISCSPNYPPSRACTSDQQQAIDSVISVVQGQRRRPAIISANRGRGKSAALGLAIGQLLDTQQVNNTLLTASSLEQVNTVFKHALAVLPGARLTNDGKCLEHPNGTLSYISADALITEPRECDLLIVDEASTLGVARLEALLLRYSRIAFSGTERGYEGSGRGFSLKFRQLVLAHCRGQYTVKLKTPVRWPQNDPLENWTNHLLLLDDNLPRHENPLHVRIDQLTFREIGQSLLAENETLLKEVIGLLVNAHYQTRPMDCRYLLDAPNSRLFVATHQNQTIGLVWLMLEGGLESDIARQIVAGNRRPQGHLAPQILAAHLGLEQAATLRCARIQRIAVSPLLQGRGTGSWMLAQVEQHLEKEYDYLAGSFGADLPLCSFWRHAGYSASRVSDKPQAASGLHSVLMLKPRSDAAHTLIFQAVGFFRAQFINQLADGLARFPADLARLLASDDSAQLELTQDELKAAVLFAYAQRPFESSLTALSKIARYCLVNTAPESTPGSITYSLFINRLLQHQPWSVCSDALGLEGQKACVKQLRQNTRQILKQACPEGEIVRLRSQFEL